MQTQYLVRTPSNYFCGQILKSLVITTVAKQTLSTLKKQIEIINWYIYSSILLITLTASVLNPRLTYHLH